MYQQHVKGRSVSTPLGILIVLGIAASIVLVSWLEQAIRMTTGFQYGAAAVWVLVVAEAVAVMRLSVMEFRYTIADGRFFIERVYGDHARIVHNIACADILAVGGEDEIFKKYGNGQAYDRAAMKGVSLPRQAVAYRGRDGEPVRLIVFQPDEEFLRRLRSECARAGAEN